MTKEHHQTAKQQASGAGGAQDGVYSLTQGDNVVGFVVLTGGSQSWWLAAAYEPPTIEDSAVVGVTYTWVQAVPANFDPANPVLPAGCQLSDSTLVTGTSNAVSAADAFPFVAPPKVTIDMQVDPMIRPGFIGMYAGSMTAAAAEDMPPFGYVVAFYTQDDRNGTRVQEHWFLNDGGSMPFQSDGIGRLVSYVGWTLADVPDWWDARKDKSGTFHRAKFMKEVGADVPGARSVMPTPVGRFYVDCSYATNIFHGRHTGRRGTDEASAE